MQIGTRETCGAGASVVASGSMSIAVTVQTEFFTVLDDVLPRALFDKLWNFLQIQQMRRVESLQMRGHWLIEDDNVLRGPTIGWGHKWDAQFPTGSPIDDVMRSIVSAGELVAPSVGHRDVDWQVFSAM